MNFLSYKMQFMCLLLLMYITYSYVINHAREDRERRLIYSLMLITADCNVILDMVTVYTVNHLEIVNITLNRILHLLFYCSILTFLFLSFLYIVRLCRLNLSSRGIRILYLLPYIVAVICAAIGITNLEFCVGKYTNYSMGYSAYACYGVGFMYFFISVIIFIKRIRYISHKKQILLVFTNVLIVVTIIVQMLYPEILITSLPATIIVLSYYLAVENGNYENSNKQQKDMIHCLADIVESRDGSTGGHIKRTSKYVELLAGRLRDKSEFQNMLTQDYVEALLIAAPMHDIGKVAIPDSILQKPGKLTDEEYDIMKTHTTEGAKLVEKSLAIDNDLYKKTIFDMVYYHHEKWNGKGYPTGKGGLDIPLCARIMAVADVFDAVSQKRCYRDAMSLDSAFDIIKKGIGTDFDPVIAQCFLDNRDAVEKIHGNLNGSMDEI